MPIAVGVIFPLDVAALNAKLHLFAVCTIRTGNIGEGNQVFPFRFALVPPLDAGTVFL